MPMYAFRASHCFAFSGSAGEAVDDKTEFGKIADASEGIMCGFADVEDHWDREAAGRFRAD